MLKNSDYNNILLYHFSVGCFIFHECYNCFLNMLHVHAQQMDICMIGFIRSCGAVGETPDYNQESGSNPLARFFKEGQ